MTEDIIKAENELNKAEAQALSIVNTPIPQRAYGRKGVNLIQQRQFITDQNKAAEALKQIQAEKQKLEDYKRQQQEYDSAVQRARDFETGRQFALRGKLAKLDNEAQLEGYKFGNQERQAGTSRSKFLNTLSNEGLKPIISKGEVIGFEDSKLQKSYSVTDIPAIIQELPAQQVRYENVGFKFEKVKGPTESFNNSVQFQTLGSNNNVQTSEGSLYRNYSNDSNIRLDSNFSKPLLSSQVSIDSSTLDGSNSRSQLGLRQNESSKRDAYFEKVERYRQEYSNKGFTGQVIAGFSPIFLKPIEAAAYPVKTTKAVITTTGNLGLNILRDPFYVNKKVVQEGPKVISNNVQLFKDKPVYATSRALSETAAIFGPKAVVSASDFVRTAGLKELRQEAVVAPEFFKGQRYPQIKKGQTAGELLDEFNNPALPGETKPAGFTATPKPFKKETTALAGTSELPGVYQAPRLSATFLRVSGEEGKVFSLNPLGTLRPTAVRTTPTAYELPPGVKRSSSVDSSKLPSIKEFFETKAEPGKAYVPFIKTEKEAVIPAGTVLRQNDKRFFFRFEGRRIPIIEFEVIGGNKVSSKSNVRIEDVSSSYSPRVSSAGIVNPYTVGLYSSRQRVSSTSVNPSVSSLTRLSSSRNTPSSVSSLFSSSKSNTRKSSSLPSIASLSFSSLISFGPTSKSGRSPRASSNSYSSFLNTNRNLNKGMRINRSPGNKVKSNKALPGFLTFFVKGGKKQYLPGINTEGVALRQGALLSTKSLRATFGIERTNKVVYGKDISYTPSAAIFRDYKISKGKKIPLSNIFIQRKGGREGGFGRLSSKGEIAEIQSIKRSKINMRGIL